jgi:hypothetical protein
LKWFCSHALQTVDGILVDLDTAEPGPERARLLKAAREFDCYLRANADRIPNYGERHRAGEAISTAFTESAVNQRCGRNTAEMGHVTLNKSLTLADAGCQRRLWGSRRACQRVSASGETRVYRARLATEAWPE